MSFDHDPLDETYFCPRYGADCPTPAKCVRNGCAVPEGVLPRRLPTHEGKFMLADDLLPNH